MIGPVGLFLQRGDALGAWQLPPRWGERACLGGPHGEGCRHPLPSTGLFWVLTVEAGHRAPTRALQQWDSQPTPCSAPCRGFSYVDLVEGLRDGRFYALKRILCHDKEDRQAALHEVEMHGLFDHPNILRLEAHCMVEKGTKHEAWLLLPYVKVRGAPVATPTPLLLGAAVGDRLLAFARGGPSGVRWKHCERKGPSCQSSGFSSSSVASAAGCKPSTARAMHTGRGLAAPVRGRGVGRDPAGAW